MTDNLSEIIKSDKHYIKNIKYKTLFYIHKIYMI